LEVSVECGLLATTTVFCVAQIREIGRTQLLLVVSARFALPYSLRTLFGSMAVSQELIPVDTQHPNQPGLFRRFSSSEFTETPPPLRCGRLGCIGVTAVQKFGGVHGLLWRTAYGKLGESVKRRLVMASENGAEHVLQRNGLSTGAFGLRPIVFDSTNEEAET